MKCEIDNKEEDENSFDFYLFRQSVKQTLGNEGLKFLYEKEKSEKIHASDSPLKKVFNKLMEIDEEDLLDESFGDLPNDKRRFDEDSPNEDFLFLDSEENESFSKEGFLDEEDTTDVIHIIEKKKED